MKVDEYIYSDNNILIELFIKVFESEIIPNSYSSQQAIDIQNCLLEEKKDYLIKHWPELNLLIFGFRNCKIVEAVNDYEFYLSILNFFHNYGKIYRTTYFSELKYEEVIAVSFYNYQTDSIDVLEYSFEKEHRENTKLIHLHFLNSIKSITYQLLKDLVDKQIDTNKIKLFAHKFKTNESNTEEGDQFS